MVVGPVVADLREAVRRLAEQGARTINAGLNTPRYQDLQQALSRLVADPSFTYRAQRPAAAEPPRSLAKAVRGLDRRQVEADALEHGRAQDEALHEARKAGNGHDLLVTAAAPHHELTLQPSAHRSRT
jgi:hypothetical protein